MPSAVSFIPPSTASNLIVLLFGAGPGLYFDFATFNFHVPARLSAAMTVTLRSATTVNTAKHTTMDLVLIQTSSFFVIGLSLGGMIRVPKASINKLKPHELDTGVVRIYSRATYPETSK